MTESLTELCRRVEAYETPRWAIQAILDVELTNKYLLDPCCGLGAIGEDCRERLLDLQEFDIEDWAKHMPGRCRFSPYFWPEDFLPFRQNLEAQTVIMHPPFSKAEAFVDRAKKLGARKIICFQRQAWRESETRRQWWEANPPARVWVCGSRATCWRFDLLDTDLSKRSGSSVSMAWYIWERGHKGAEVTSAIYPEASR